MDNLLEIPLKVAAENLDEAIEIAIKMIENHDKYESQTWEITLLSIRFTSNSTSCKEYLFDRGVIK